MSGNSERETRRMEKEARDRARNKDVNKAPKPDEKFIKQLEKDNRGNNGNR